jgi:riboflavin biosynthesis pyrimidine reductase
VPVTEDEDGQLEPYSILSALTNEGVTSVLIEGGANLLRTFYDKDLIDEIYLYTSTEELENASLTNPIRISEDWDVKESKRLGEDSLVIAQRKVKCLQES